MRTILIALVALGVLACTQSRAADSPLPPIDPTRLSHAQHAQVPCGVPPHRRRGPARMTTSRATTARATRRIPRPPGELCQVCHTRSRPRPLAAPLKPYPLEDAWQTSRRSSRTSRTSTRADGGQASGFTSRASTATCATARRPRPITRRARAVMPPRPSLPNAPKMADCAGCHENGRARAHRARLIKDDLHFDHGRHKTDRKRRPISASSATRRPRERGATRDHAPPRVESCVTCHDDTDRTPGEMRMRVCETCHAARAKAAHDDRAAQPPTRDGTTARSHARVPPRPRRGRRARARGARRATRTCRATRARRATSATRRCCPPITASRGASSTTAPRPRPIAIAARAATSSSSAPHVTSNARARMASRVRS